MNTQHTLGPWHVTAYDQNTALVYAHTGHAATPITNVCTATEANARLIAAAPELLDFAETVAMGNTEYADLERMARELIAKAGASC
jgi:hypothetical protein